jgi:hypothetical protein
MKKILMICMLFGSSFIFTKGYNLHGVHGDQFIMCYEGGRGGRDRLVLCVNDSLKKGYQLHGSTNMFVDDVQRWSQSLIKK